MRLAGSALLVILVSICALNITQGYPLHASNGVINCTVFGAFKDPYTVVDFESGKRIVFNLDIGLARLSSPNMSVDNVAFSLVDGNDRLYPSNSQQIRYLQTNRLLLGFLVPKEIIPKSLIIDPSKDLTSGNRFAIDFNELTNASNGMVRMVYYGIIGSRIDDKVKSIDLDISMANNQSTNLSLSYKNFSLIDQWGWKYGSQDYSSYTNDGFKATVLAPNESVRTELTFKSLSSLSRPSKLEYDYSKDSSLIIDIDTEFGLQGPTIIEPTAPEESKPSEQSEPAPTSLAGSIKATKARLAKVRESL